MELLRLGRGAWQTAVPAQPAPVSRHAASVPAVDSCPAELAAEEVLHVLAGALAEAGRSLLEGTGPAARCLLLTAVAAAATGVLCFTLGLLVGLSCGGWRGWAGQ